MAPSSRSPSLTGLLSGLLGGGRALAAIVVAGTLSLALSGACSGRAAPSYGTGSSSSSGAGGAGGEGFNLGQGGGCDSLGACGSEIHQVTFDAPNIYFVIDASGSMADLEPGTNKSRYNLVRAAATEVILNLGPRINVGAAVFPYGDLNQSPCSPGEEVMAITPGDPTGDDTGTVAMFEAATKLSPFGGTPVAATLENLVPNLSAAAAERRTIVLLLTDGGPNCNPDLVCGVSGCMPNIEGVCVPTENCCAVDHPSGGPLLCLDDQATIAAVGDVAALGVDVYVIGISDSALYASTLDAMAVAAGTAEPGSPSYQQVTDLSALESTFSKIAAEAVSCELSVGDPPADKGFTNVYFDCDVVTYDPAQGWDWLDDGTIRLNGASCAKLKSGEVSEVKIATGCPTEVPE